MESEKSAKRVRKMTPVWRTVVEVGFIVFLFYSNLLMGQYIGSGPSKGLLWAIQNVITPANFTIALVTAFIGHLVFDFLRKRL